MDAITISGVSKAYHSKLAVDAVTLHIPAGQVFGLLGPNGAGKTSLIRMITQITKPDTGSIQFFGNSLSEAHRSEIGYMPEERGLYRKMKVLEQLVYLLQLKGMQHQAAQSAANKWLERMELGKWAKAKVSELSKGMQQKVQFIATVAHNPRLVILDEPFSGLDPLNAQLLEDIMVEMAANGQTIIFSTHRMEQVERFCPSIALIHNGKIVLEGQVHSLRRRFRKPVYFFECDTPVDLSKIPPGFQVIQHLEYAAQVASEMPMTISELVGILGSVFTLSRVEHVLPSLRDIFIETVKVPID